MEIIKTPVDPVIIFKPDVFSDSRGYFYESFSERRYYEAGIKNKFVQDNISRSIKGTVRGLHYQVGENAQGKLCSVLMGRVLDVAVDIRFGSPNFGKYFSFELSDENKCQMWIPAGFAHGFAVLSDTAIFSYKCTAYYSKKDERTIIYNDPDLCIDWKTTEVNISEKDSNAGPFKNINQDFIYKPL